MSAVNKDNTVIYFSIFLFILGTLVGGVPSYYVGKMSCNPCQTVRIDTTITFEKQKDTSFTEIKSKGKKYYSKKETKKEPVQVKVDSFYFEYTKDCDTTLFVHNDTITNDSLMIIVSDTTSKKPYSRKVSYSYLITPVKNIKEVVKIKEKPSVYFGIKVGASFDKNIKYLNGEKVYTAGFLANVYYKKIGTSFSFDIKNSMIEGGLLLKIY